MSTNLEFPASFERSWVLRVGGDSRRGEWPGIFVAEDVRQGAVRRVASAVGEGAIAVGLVHPYLKTV
jgi:thioredoxin reductase (NADPH)